MLDAFILSKKYVVRDSNNISYFLWVKKCLKITHILREETLIY